MFCFRHANFQRMLSSWNIYSCSYHWKVLANCAHNARTETCIENVFYFSFMLDRVDHIRSFRRFVLRMAGDRSQLILNDFQMQPHECNVFDRYFSRAHDITTLILAVFILDANCCTDLFSLSSVFHNRTLFRTAIIELPL